MWASCYFREFRFLELLMLLHSEWTNFSFRLTRKPYPRFCLSTMGALLTAPAVAHTQWLRHSIVVGHTFNKE